MTVWVLTKIEKIGLTTRAFREQWDAIKAAETEAAAVLVWSPPPDYEAQHFAAETPELEYLLDELEVMPRSEGPKVKSLTLEVDPPNADSVQYHANGISLGAPDTSAPYKKTWNRPAGQADPVEIEAQVVYEDGSTYRGVVCTVD